MAFALVTSANITGTTGGTTTAIDTTGANLLIVAVSWFSGTGGIASVTVSDSKGNTWTPLTNRDSGNASFRLFYVQFPATVGTGHTVTISGGTQYSVSTFWAFSGIAIFSVESGATVAGTSLASGSVTPSTNGALIITGWTGMNTPSSPGVSGGFTSTTNIADVPTVNVDGAHGYLIQTTAAAINPTWTWTGSDQAAVATAVFLVDPGTTIGRISQLPLEVATLSDAPIQLRISQVPLEVVTLTEIIPRVTESIVEVLSSSGTAVSLIVTQDVIEILSASVIIPSAVEKTEFFIVAS